MTVLLLFVNVVLAHSFAKISNNSSSFKKVQFSELNSKSLSFSLIKKEDVNDELLSEFDNETDLEEEDVDTESISIYTQASFDLFCSCSFIQKDQKRNSYYSNQQQKTTKLPVWLKVRHIIL